MFKNLSFKWLIYSGLSHIILFVFVLSGGIQVFFKTHTPIQSAVRVDMTGLPELKPPRPAFQKKGLAKKAAKAKKPKKKPKPKKKAKKKPKLNKNPPKQKKIEQVQKAQAQALKRLQEEAPSPRVFKGRQVQKGQADGEDKTAAEQLEIQAYFTAVRAHIKLYWQLPQELADQGFRAKVYTAIDGKGAVLNKKIFQSSGNEEFDTRVLETIQRASPFPPPPYAKNKKTAGGGSGV